MLVKAVGLLFFNPSMAPLVIYLHKLPPLGFYGEKVLGQESCMRLSSVLMVSLLLFMKFNESVPQLKLFETGALC